MHNVPGLNGHYGSMIKSFIIVTEINIILVLTLVTCCHSVKLRKLHDTERPLQLALHWSSQDQTKQFVLQENDNSDIRWEDFALPELENFLKILNLEEEEYLNQVRLKYRMMHKKIQEAMDHLCPPRKNLDGTPVAAS